MTQKNNIYNIKYLKNYLHVYNVLVSYNTRQTHFSSHYTLKASIYGRIIKCYQVIEHSSEIMLRNLFLIIFIAEKALPTDVVETNRINDNTINLQTKLKKKPYIFQFQPSLLPNFQYPCNQKRQNVFSHEEYKSQVGFLLLHDHHPRE